MSVRVEHADMLQAIPALVAEGIVCDSCVTDPPYHLLPTVKRLAPSAIGGTQVVEQKAAARADAIGRLAGGFMGQQWDGGDIAFRPETWATVATILRPGAFLVAFGGTRTVHRMTSAIEDAGFVIQDCLMWLFATGFPKRRDHLKPAYEPIVLAYKPGGKRTMQADECRIAATDNTTKEWRAAGDRSREDYRTGTSGRPIPTDLGRWPANVCHDGSDEVAACFPESAGQSGVVTGLEPSTSTRNVLGLYGERAAAIPRNDTGSAARFFMSAKAGPQDRWGSRHPTVKPVDLIAWLVKLVTPPGGTFLDPFAGSGTAAVAALRTGRSAILIEREAGYVADIHERIAFYEGGGGHSAQVKNRNRKVDHGPLFAEPANAIAAALNAARPSLTPDERERDSIGSYAAAIETIGEEVKAGAREVPTTGYFARRGQE